MALEFEVVNVNLGKGVNTKTDDKYSIPGELILLENGVFDKIGTLNKRPGDAALSTTVADGSALTNTAGRKLATLEDTLLLLTKHTSFSGEDPGQIGNDYITEWGPNPNLWSKRAGAFDCQIETDPIYRNTPAAQAQPENMDAAYLNGVLYYATTEGNRAWVFAVDETTRAVLWTLSDSSGSTNDGPVKLLVLSGKLYLLRHESGANIHIREITGLTGTPAFSGKQLLINNLSANRKYDAVVGNGLIYLAYDGTVQIEVKSYNTSVITGALGTPPTPVATSSIAGQVADRCITVAVLDNTRVRVGWADAVATAVKSNEFLSSLGASVSGTLNHDITTTGIIENITIGTKPTQLNGTDSYYPIVWDENYATEQFYCRLRIDGFISPAGAALGNPRMLANSLTLGSKVFTEGTGANTRHYVVGAYGSPAQSARYVIGISNFATVLHSRSTVLARAFYGRCLSASLASCAAPQVVAGSTSDLNEAGYFCPVLATSVGGLEAGGTYFIHSLKMKFNPLSLFQEVEMARNAHFCGGVLGMYDGVNFTEHGFLHYPEKETTPLAPSAGGGLTALGTYSYVAVPEYFDNLGQRHQGAPSIPMSITLTGGNQTVTIRVPAIKMSNKRNLTTAGTVHAPLYKFRIYRTVSLGSIYYDTGNVITPNFNNDYDSVVDTATDAAIQNNETLYTTGDVLENIPPPASNCITVFNDRVFVGTEEGIYYSKLYSPGLPIQFSDAFVIPVETLGGRPIALFPFGNKLLIFKKNSIHYVTGDGPFDTGAGSDFSAPEIINKEIGTAEPNSIMEVPDGIIFKSAKGFYLMDVSFRLTYLGAAVEYFNNLTVVSSDLIKDKNQVRFLTDVNDAGVTLVYDFYAQQWSTFPSYYGEDAVIWNQKYIRLNTNPLQEDANFLLGGAAYALKLRTNWLTFTQIQGLQRVRKLVILGRFKSHHVLNVQFAYDYNPKVVDTIQIDTQGAGKSLTVIPEAAIYATTAFTGADIYQFRIGLPRQKFESVQITIYDSNHAGTNESFSLTGLAFEVGMKRTVNKIKEAFSQ